MVLKTINEENVKGQWLEKADATPLIWNSFVILLFYISIFAYAFIEFRQEVEGHRKGRG